jgi:hypothetical protein
MALADCLGTFRISYTHRPGYVSYVLEHSAHLCLDGVEAPDLEEGIGGGDRAPLSRDVMVNYGAVGGKVDVLGSTG